MDIRININIYRHICMCMYLYIDLYLYIFNGYALFWKLYCTMFYSISCRFLIPR